MQNPFSNPIAKVLALALIFVSWAECDPETEDYKGISNTDVEFLTGSNDFRSDIKLFRGGYVRKSKNTYFYLNAATTQLIYSRNGGFRNASIPIFDAINFSVLFSDSPDKFPLMWAFPIFGGEYGIIYENAAPYFENEIHYFLRRGWSQEIGLGVHLKIMKISSKIGIFIQSDNVWRDNTQFGAKISLEINQLN